MKREQEEEAINLKGLIILIVVSFLLTTVLVNPIINPMLKLEGAVEYFATAAEFILIAFVLYKPIMKKFE